MINFFKIALSSIFLLFFLAEHVSAERMTGAGELDEILLILINNDYLEIIENTDNRMAVAFCEHFNSSRPSVCRVNAITGGFTSFRELSLAEGICLAGNGQRPSVCQVNAITGGFTSFREISLAEGICLAGNGQRPSVCQNRRHSFQEFAIQDAILLLPSDDTSWAWDGFRDQYGNLVWACRGVQTGQFSFLVRCHDRPKNDLTWPG